jgi:integrase
MEMEPIKDPAKITEIRTVLKSGRNGLRDELLFVFGINTAFRISDILDLTINDVVDNGLIKTKILVTETKTKKMRDIPLNSIVVGALKAYLASRGPLNQLPPTEPLFPSQKGKSEPLTRQQAYRIINAAAKKVGVPRIGSHSLRKTFAYHAYMRSGQNLALIQGLLKHATSGVTLRYIGITKDEEDAVFINLKLG